MPKLKVGKSSIQIVVTDAEKARLQQAADLANLPLATWLRVQALAASSRAKSSRPAGR